MKDFVAVIVLAVASFILWGVGNFTLRKSGDRTAAWPVAIGVGLAVMIFAGGILNCAHVAFGPVLWALAGVAAVISVLETKHFKFEPIQGRSAWIELIATGLVIAVVTGFAIHTQLPPKAFNVDDDFRVYFTHPVSMLATGSLLGGPLSGLGTQTLGGQAFLQGYVLSVLPIGYINGVDAVFGFMVVMLICASAGWRRYTWFPGALLGPVMVAMISPEYVNVSGLFTGSVLMATAVMLVIEEKDETGASPLILGLLYAALISVKPTFALFPVLHLPLAALTLESQKDPWKKPHPWMDAFNWTGRVALWAGLGLAPWVATHLPNYLATGTFRSDPTPAGDEGGFDLLSLYTTKYGDCALIYTIAVGCVALATLGAAIFGFADRPGRRRRLAMGLLAAGVACVVTYLMFLCVLGAAWFGFSTSLRYIVPTLLGSGVPAMVLFPRLAHRVKSEVLAGFSVGFCAVIGIIFSGSTVARYQQAMHSGSILAFYKLADTDHYTGYCEFCLSKGTTQRLRGLQSRIPAGESILADLSTPFLLDFRRNPIVNLEPGGLLAGWARVPANVRYVLWQYQAFTNFGDLGVTTVDQYTNMIAGPGAQDRTIGVRGLAFSRHLAELRTNSVEITNDGEIVVFKLAGPFK